MPCFAVSRKLSDLLCEIRARGENAKYLIGNAVIPESGSKRWRFSAFSNLDPLCHMAGTRPRAPPGELSRQLKVQIGAGKVGRRPRGEKETA